MLGWLLFAEILNFCTFLNAQMIKPSGIDRIIGIETAPTQMIITTTKEGPTEQLSVKIEVTDLQDHRIFTPISLNGLFLLISRGRYTVPFLRPDHFYGVYFQSENTVNGVRMFHNETRIVKTMPRHGENTTNNFVDPRFEPTLTNLFHFNNSTKNPADLVVVKQIYVHRNDENGGSNTEGVFVTIKWLTERRIPGSFLSIKIRVLCEHTNATENVHLRDTEAGITLEIAMDHKMDVEDMEENSHQIKANISPLKCREICWDVDYVLPVLSRNFTREFNRTCEKIEGTTTTTFVRELKSYKVIENTLYVHTEIPENQADHGVVTLSAQNLAESIEEPIFKEYQVASTPNGTFMLQLEEGNAYAITYKYIKALPFKYSTKDHFMVEIPASKKSGNSSKDEMDSGNLVDFVIDPPVLNITSEGEFVESPKISLEIGPKYAGQNVSLKTEDFCGSTIIKGNRVDFKKPEVPLELPLKKMVCGLERNLTMCQNVTSACADTKFCYTPTVLRENIAYEGPRKCIDLARTLEYEVAKEASRIFSWLLQFLLAWIVITR